MPDLRCTVQTCTHNQNYYCNLDSIVVGGNSAKHLPRVTWIVRQQTVCITKNVSVMQERSV